jgi:hypothetical protein
MRAVSAAACWPPRQTNLSLLDSSRHEFGDLRAGGAEQSAELGDREGGFHLVVDAKFREHREDRVGAVAIFGAEAFLLGDRNFVHPIARADVREDDGEVLVARQGARATFTILVEGTWGTYVSPRLPVLIAAKMVSTALYSERRGVVLSDRPDDVLSPVYVGLDGLEGEIFAQRDLLQGGGVEDDVRLAYSRDHRGIITHVADPEGQ